MQELGILDPKKLTSEFRVVGKQGAGRPLCCLGNEWRTAPAVPVQPQPSVTELGNLNTISRRLLPSVSLMAKPLILLWGLAQ